MRSVFDSSASRPGASRRPPCEAPAFLVKPFSAVSLPACTTKALQGRRVERREIIRLASQHLERGACHASRS